MLSVILFLLPLVVYNGVHGLKDEYNASISSAVKYLNVGVLMASQLDSPFDLERCGPAVDLALEEVNEVFLKHHQIQLRKVQGR